MNHTYVKLVYKYVDIIISIIYNKFCRKEVTEFKDAGVAELADAQDLKSCGGNSPYRFDSGLQHQTTRGGAVGSSSGS